MSLRTTSQNRASTFTFTNSRSGGSGGVGTGSVTITSIVVTDSGFNNLDDSAIGTSNSYIKIIGTGFSSSANVFVSGSQVSSVNVTYVNSTEIRVTLPSLSLGNTNIFVFNPDYSGAIWAPGITVSGFPDFTQTSYTSSTPLEVSVQLLATGDAPLTYALQAGSSLPSGCSLSSSGLITGTTVDGVYQFTVIVSDAQLQSFQFQITLTITSGDQYFNRTVLAINGDVNTFVTDASSNNFPTTITGATVVPTSFSPYNTDWSNFFDGTGDYLNVASNSAFTLGSSGDFTVECWCYLTATPNNYTPLITTWTDANNAFTNRWAINIYGSKLSWFNDAGGIGIADSSNIGLNQWIHVAAVRSGSTITLYKNGVSLGTQTTSQAYTTQSGVTIGFVNNGGYITGWISNARVVKGTAVYTGAFTPSTTPLTAVTNTSLLTCQSNLIVDKSNNAFEITTVGNTKVSSFGPFIETNLTAGSTYFDTSAGGLTISSNAALDMGTGNFTIEGWYYPNAADSDFNSAFYLGTINGGNALGLAVSNVSIRYRSAGGSDRIVVGSLNLTKSWNHIALVRASGTTNIYLNGIAVGSAYADPTSYSSSGNLVISRPDAASFRYVGHIADFRIVKGTAVYTANFTPPTTPLTAIANTSLLILQTRQPVTNHTFIDESGNNLLITKSGNVSQGSFSPYSPAGWSNYFDGTGDYIQMPVSSAFAFGSGDFTIETWIYPTGGATKQYIIGNVFNSSDGDSALAIYLGSSNEIIFQTWFTVLSTSSNSVVTKNIWNHIAAVRSGTTISVFVNGTRVNTFSNSSNFSRTTGYQIGMEGTSSAPFTGYVSNARVVKGTAIYNASSTTITVPTTPLTAVSNTSLLTCQNNRFIDSSNNAFAVTVAGNPSVQAFAPFRPTNEYSLATHGGSIYFDGTGDFLDIASSSGFAFGTGDFTVEGWFYLNRTGQHRLIDFANERLIYIDGNTRVVYYLNANAIVSSALVANAWYHFALSRSSGSTKLFLNGVQAGSTYTDSANYPASAPTIGRDRSNSFFHQGYISDLCVSKTARYTSNFSVPTTPISLIPNASLILKSNPAIVDVSSRNVMETVGDAKIVSSIRKYGTGCMFFDGTGDYLAIRPTNELYLSNADFTIEGWIHPTSVVGTSGYNAFFGMGYAVQVYWYNNTVLAAFNDSDDSLSYLTSTLSGPSNSALINTWSHFAVVRNGSTWTIFVNGVAGTPQTFSGTIANSATVTSIGILAADSQYRYAGYIDDFRITKFARYTANFTAPTATFLAQ